jgi:hypothetical protein
MVSNSTIINKPKNHLSPSLITEQKKTFGQVKLNLEYRNQNRDIEG